MSINHFIQEKNNHLLRISEITKRMKEELNSEKLEDLLALDDQRDLYINEIKKIDRSISLLIDKGCKVSDISGSETRKEIDAMHLILQDLIQQDKELVRKVKGEMDIISGKMREIGDAKKLILGYLSSNNPSEGFIDYNI